MIYGVQDSDQTHITLLSIGSSIVAAGIVSILIQLLFGNPFDALFKEIESTTDILKNRLRSAVQVLESSSRTGVESAWNSRSDLSLDSFQKRMRNSSSRIDFLAYAMAFIPEHPDTIKNLTDRAKSGVKIRILLANPNGKNVQERNDELNREGSISNRIKTSLARLRPLTLQSNVEIRLYDEPHYCSLYRLDINACNSTLVSYKGTAAPLIEFKEIKDGLF